MSAPIGTQEPALAGWLGLWSEALGTPLAAELRHHLTQTGEALLAAYREPQRHYHTLQHLQECLALFDSVRSSSTEHPAEVGLALWFHDAIYEVHRHDNEARSADWAVRVAGRAGLPTAATQRLRELVLVTRHDGAARTRDEQCLVDIDLAILGASPERFDEYEAQVRREYRWVPGPLFRSKRREILKVFLARQPLYHSDALAQRLEAPARTNLQRSLQALGGA
ncbi:MAG: N-methyl-D-aspartate receptor NMDAR2C subunit [Pseudomonadota bacterium]